MKRNISLPKVLLALCLLLGSNVSSHAASYADLPDLNLLTPYATFGNYYNDSNVTINGDVGISNKGILSIRDKGTLSLAAPSTINGNLYLGTNSTKTGVGTVTGSTTMGVDFTAAQSQVFTASTALRNLTADYTVGAVTNGMTFTAKGPVTVIDMSSLELGNGEDIVFSGSSSDYFILNISGGMALTGDASIGNIGDTSRIILNLFKSGKLGTVAHVGNVINATTLIPYATTTFHSVNGAVYSGEQQITLMSDSTVNHIPFAPPVPIPGIIVLLPSGLAVVALAHRKIQAKLPHT